MSLTKEECFQCIAECMAESLPGSWKTAWMDAELNGNEISVDYFYEGEALGNIQKFKTENIFAPLNAIKAIRDIMSSEGHNWFKAKFRISSSGTFELEVIE